MAIVEISDDRLIIKMQGARKLWTLKSELSIPLKNVIGIEIDTTAWQNSPTFGQKCAGADMYGFYFGGTFVQDGDKVFYDLKHKEKAVAILLKDEEYSRLVVGVDEPVTTLEAVRKELII